MTYVLALLLALTTDCTELRRLSALYEIRSAMLRPYSNVPGLIDSQIDELREPIGGGDYRWVRWVRPSDEGPVEKHGHTVLAVDGTNTDRVEKASHHAYAVRVVVPRKRSLLNANNPVWVGTVEVSYEVEGKPRTKTETVNAWLNPDTSRTIDLGGIAERVDVAMDVATAQRHVKEAIVEIHYRQAVMQDDPANPGYDTIRMLHSLRNSATAYDVDEEIARAERAVFADANPLPLLGIIADLRRADDLMRSSKDDDREKGEKLLKETMRRLR
jgi:hypothetical protein